MLGPRLCIIYVSDFPESVTKGELYMIADDTALFTIGYSVDKVPSVLLKVASEVRTRCYLNKLTIHEGMTDVLILDSKKFTGLVFPIKLCETFI